MSTNRVVVVDVEGHIVELSGSSQLPVHTNNYKKQEHLRCRCSTAKLM